MSELRTCIADGCDRSVESRGYCGMHYQRTRTNGTPTSHAPNSTDITDSDRFWNRVSVGRADECWEYVGETNNHGYGRFCTYVGQRRVRHFAHRYILDLLGLLNPELIVMHACDNPPCCNPAHLSQGTQLDNMRDCLAKGRMNTDGLIVGWMRTWGYTTEREREHLRRAGAA